MDKKVLEEYIDACEVIKDTEEEIRKLESKKRITAMKRYLEVIRNFLTIHSTLKYRGQHTLIQTM